MVSNYSKRSKARQGSNKQACSPPGQGTRQGYLYHGRITGLLVVSLLLFLMLSMFPTMVRADGGFPIIGVLHAGKSPEGIAVDVQTHMVYIAYEFPSLIVGFDASSGKVQWSAAVGDSATEVQVDSTKHRVYAISTVFKSREGLLAILDGATGKLLLTTKTAFGDDGLALDSRRQRAYVSSSDGGFITAFTLVTSATGRLSMVSSKLTAGPHPQALGVNSRSGRLYVGDVADNTVTVIDEESGRTLATIPVAAVPVQPLRVDEVTGRVYVVCSSGQELDVIDGNANKVTARIPVSPYPEGVAFNTATGRIYVAGEGQKETSFTNSTSGTTITVIDGQSFDVLGTLRVGKAPDGVETDPQLRRVYVAVENSDAVVEISDSVNLPLVPNTNFHQAATVHQAISLLQRATVITVLMMFLTLVTATLNAWSRRWRARGSPQIPPGGASFR